MNSDKNAEKLRKKHIREQFKRIQPSECQKYVRMVIDENLVHTTIGRNLMLELESSQLKYNVRQLPEKYCIVWERSMGQQTFTINNREENLPDINPTGLTNKWQIENQTICIFSFEEFQKALQKKSLDSTIESIKLAFPAKRITLIIPSLPTKTSNNVHLEREMLLTELQINHECNIIQIKSKPAELLELLKRFTKAVAEEPYKKQKSAAQTGFKKYLINDNKQCVRVEGTNGLGRLWQQHLNRLPMITLDVAETIRTEYSCPKKFLDDIQQHPDGKAKIADLQINRGAGIFNANRRIGNVLSSKLIKLYQTKNPTEFL